MLGAHDQCLSALGAGVTRSGQAAYGIGTYVCITPTYDAIPPTAACWLGSSTWSTMPSPACS